MTDYPFQVLNFVYNGFGVISRKGITKYRAKFNKWTNDPGIGLFDCDDNKQRPIPSCCLLGDISSLPIQDYSNKVYLGQPCSS